MKQIRVAILGQGRSGRDIHGLHLKKDTERFKVAAVVEPFDVRRERAASEYPGCDTYSDYRALLERKDIDLVVNATPSHLHFPITKEFLSAGFNVLTEKPFVPTVAECDELTALAKEKGVHLGRPQLAVPPEFMPLYQQWRQKSRPSKELIAQSGMSYQKFYRTCRKLRQREMNASR